MPDDIHTLATQLMELHKALDAFPSPKEGKDIWDKLGVFSSAFGAVVIGTVGAFATHLYNKRQLDQQSRTDADKSVLAHAETLEKFWLYVVSLDPQKRAFGYEMFVILGQARLAVRLIALNQDQAGGDVIAKLKDSTDPALRKAAQQTLTRLQEAVLRRVIMKREGTDYGKVFASEYPPDTLYGLGAWGVNHGGLYGLLGDYADRPGAAFSHEAKNLLADGKVVNGPDLAPALEKMGADPVMRQAQDDLFHTQFVAPMLVKVRKTGVHLPLSIAVLCDTASVVGAASIDSIIAQATKTSKSDPAMGGDEKLWTLAVLQARRDHFDRLGAAGGVGNPWRSIDPLSALAAQGDWLMASVGADAALTGS